MALFGRHNREKGHGTCQMYSLICFCVSGFSHDLFGVVKEERNGKGGSIKTSFLKIKFVLAHVGL